MADWRPVLVPPDSEGRLVIGKHEVSVNKENGMASGKRNCVLGVLASKRGLWIRDELRSWLDRSYNVTEVHADPPNDREFERPFLRKACEMAIATGEPVLYVHTKGAANKFVSAPMVRDIWEQSFGVDTESYFRAVSTEEPTAASPLVSSRKHVCWFNGYVLNVAAARAMLAHLDKPVYRDRFWYEQGLLEDAGVHVVGWKDGLDSPEATCSYLATAWHATLARMAAIEDRYQVMAAMAITRANAEQAHRTIRSVLSVSKPVKLVLTASQDEFPRDIQDLPESLLDCLRDRHVRILWLHGRGMVPFGATLYTMSVMPFLPVATVGQGCVYTEDYIGRLYRLYQSDPNGTRYAWTYAADTATPGFVFPDNRATLYPADCFRTYGLTGVAMDLLSKHDSDVYAGTMCKCMGIGVLGIAKDMPCTSTDGSRCIPAVHEHAEYTVKSVLGGYQYLVLHRPAVRT